MDGCTNGARAANLFALVVYIPDPLARFLDDLRIELTPECLPRAHVTILPPRSLATKVDDAVNQARIIVSGFAPFEIHLGKIEVFPETDVIYIGIDRGERELRALYSKLNTGPLSAEEQYPYQPHVTLAQDLKSSQVPARYELARKRWAAWPQDRRIRAESAYFVRSKADLTWVDLAEIRLSGVPVA